MKATAGRGTQAFTRVELVVVTAVLVILLTILVAAAQRSHGYSARIGCVNNLKEIGVAYRTWADDHGGEYPASAPMTNDGWNELLGRTNIGAFCWAYFATLGQTSQILTCPADERRPATSSEVLKDNSHLSYFVGVEASDANPQSILSGDRNLGPGTIPDANYGFSPANGAGNDVCISGPVCWSLKMHSQGRSADEIGRIEGLTTYWSLKMHLQGRSAGAGNILFGDGSCQQTTSSAITLNWLKPALQPPKVAGGLSNAPAIRLIFP
jgi:hypothetical protein